MQIDWEMVEQADDAETIKKKERAMEYKAYLASTDWYVMRYVETQKAIPDDVTANRAKARQYIKEANQ